MSANMMRIPSLAALAEHMIPEFEERMKSSLLHDWNGVLEIRMEDQADPLGMLIGTLSYDEVRLGMPRDKTRDALLGDLFPKILTSSGVWG